MRPFKFRFPNWTMPLALLALGLLSFGILLPRLGFYWDDWNGILVNRVYGSEAFWRFYAFDRPSSAWSYVLLAPLLGSNPLAWQVFTFLLRWLSAVGMAWTFTAIWPRARSVVVGAALLFLVYPIFSQQALAVTYHQMWLEFGLYFLSLGAMVRAVRAWLDGHNRRGFLVWTVTALLAFGLNFSISEYFIGVELLRPLLLWWLISDRAPERRKWLVTAKRVFLYWLPYLLALAFFVYWRLFLVKIVGGDPNKPLTLLTMFAHPGKSLLDLLQVALRDSLQVLVAGWYQTLNPGLIELGSGFSLFAWFLAALVAVLTAIYLLQLKPGAEEVGDDRPARIPAGQMALTGLAVLLLGPAPAWITGRSLGVAPDPFSDRYAAVAMFGAALLLVAVLEWLTPRRLQKVLILSVLVGLGAGMQIRTANDYHWFFVRQTRFFWQMHWRAPNIQPGTALFARDAVFPLQGRFATSVALNLAYAQEANPTYLRSWIYALEPGYVDYVESLKRGLKLDESFRIFKFLGNTRDSLVINYRAQDSSCLWVLHPEETYAPGIGETMREALPLSNWNRIVPQGEPGFPPAEIFGPEPEHNWCFFYEKAGLALQMQDIQTLSDLEQQARAAGFGPGNSGSDVPFEWLPFVEGYARAGRWEQAIALTEEISQTKRVSTVDAMLCQFWARMQRDLPAGAERDAALRSVQNGLSCP